MREDYDDYDTGRAGKSPVMWLVIGSALLGFAGLGWYAFDSGNGAPDASQIVTLDSIEDPYKFEPEDKGGMEFPHQDKTIYDALDGNTQRESVEALYPEPEEPVIETPAITEAPAEEVKSVAQDAMREATELSKELAKATPEITTENGSAESYVAKTPVNETAEDAALVKEIVAKKAQAEKEALAKKEADAAAEKATAETLAAKKIAQEKAKLAEENAKKAAAKPAPIEPVAAKTPVKQPPVLAGAYAVQLGAYKSENEALREWQKIYNKHLSILGGTREKIVRVDLPNGTFYRLRAVGFASEADAKQACTKLGATGQACFYAGKQ